MIGIVVVTHGNIGPEMVAATRRIFPEATHIKGVAVESNDPPESIRHQISEAVAEVNRNKGVLIFTDMFGGTPSNICLSFLEASRVEVVSGVNLPMLVKLASLKSNSNFDDTVAFIQQYGQRNIVIASHVLAGKIK